MLFPPIYYDMRKIKKSDRVDYTPEYLKRQTEDNCGHFKILVLPTQSPSPTSTKWPGFLRDGGCGDNKDTTGLL